MWPACEHLNAHRAYKAAGFRHASLAHRQCHQSLHPSHLCSCRCHMGKSPFTAPFSECLWQRTIVRGWVADLRIRDELQRGASPVRAGRHVSRGGRRSGSLLVHHSMWECWQLHMQHQLVPLPFLCFLHATYCRSAAFNGLGVQHYSSQAAFLSQPPRGKVSECKHSLCPRPSFFHMAVACLPLSCVQ